MPTTRLNMAQPAGIDFVDPVAAISNQMGVIDNSILTTICTSITRPGSPFAGQEIYETDTNKLYFWTGAIWQLISDGVDLPPSSGSAVKGRQGFFIGNWSGSFGAATGAESGPALTAQLNLLKGRKYRFYCGWNVKNLDANQVLPGLLRLRGGEGASVTTASPLLYTGSSDFYGASTGFNVSHHLTAHVDIAGSGTTQHTFGIFIAKPAAVSAGRIDFSTGDTTYQYIAIEDIGG